MWMRNRVRDLREAKKLTQTELGDAIGTHYHTIQRIEKAKTRIMPKHEHALAELFGVRIEDLYLTTGMRSVRVQQHVQAGDYAESHLWPDDDGYDVLVPDRTEYKSFTLYGAEARGASMNKVYPEGTVLVYVDIKETHENLIPGKRYIVERTLTDGLRESTVKTLWKDHEGVLWLLPESTNPRFGPVILKDGAPENETIRIVGRVIFSVRDE